MKEKGNRSKKETYLTCISVLCVCVWLELFSCCAYLIQIQYATTSTKSKYNMKEKIK